MSMKFLTFPDYYDLHSTVRLRFPSALRCNHQNSHEEAIFHNLIVCLDRREDISVKVKNTS